MSTPQELSRALSHWLGETPAEGVLARVSGSTGQFKAVAPPPRNAPPPRVQPPAEAPAPARAPSPDQPPPPAPRSYRAFFMVVALGLAAVAVLFTARPELFRPRGSPSIMSR